MPNAAGLGTAPGELQGQFLRVIALAGTGDQDIIAVDGLPWFLLYNSDSSTHIVTAKGAGVGAAQGNIPFAIPAGGYLPLPVTAFRAVVDAQGNGKVYLFYTDVPIQGFNPPPKGGTSFADTERNPAAINSASQLMEGLGGNWKFTPLGSGYVLVSVVGDAVVAGAGASLTGVVTLQYGTGIAPNHGDAVTGTEAWTQNMSTNITAVSETQIDFPIGGAVLLALVAGTAYWFDLSVANGGNSTGITPRNLRFSVGQLGQ